MIGVAVVGQSDGAAPGMEVVLFVVEAVLGERVGGPKVGGFAVWVEDLGVELARYTNAADILGPS